LRLDAGDSATAAVNVTKQIALIFIGRGDLHFHDRLEQNPVGLLERVLQGKDSGHLEGQFIRVHFVEGAVNDLRFDIDNLVAGVNAPADGFFDAVDDRGDVFPRNRAPDDLVLVLDSFALFVGLNVDDGVSVLTAAARLSDELALAFRGSGDRFAIGNLRRAGAGLDLELAEQAVADDFQV